MDPLLLADTELRKRAKELGIAILEGTPNDSSNYVAVCRYVDVENAKEAFLSTAVTAHALGAKLIYIDMECLKAEDISEALDEVDILGENEEESHAWPKEKLARLRQEIESYRSDVGKVQELYIRFPIPGSNHFYELWTEQSWCDVIHRTSDQLENLSETEEVQLSKGQKKLLIEKLASHESFHSVTRNNEIEYLLEEVSEQLGIPVPPDCVDDIRIRAKSHFNIKVRPRRFKELKVRAAELFKEGKTRIEIANELGVSPTMLRSLTKA